MKVHHVGIVKQLNDKYFNFIFLREKKENGKIIIEQPVKIENGDIVWQERSAYGTTPVLIKIPLEFYDILREKFINNEFIEAEDICN